MRHQKKHSNPVYSTKMQSSVIIHLLLSVIVGVSAGGRREAGKTRKLLPIWLPIITTSLVGVVGVESGQIPPRIIPELRMMCSRSDYIALSERECAQHVRLCNLRGECTINQKEDQMKLDWCRHQRRESCIQNKYEGKVQELVKETDHLLRVARCHLAEEHWQTVRMYVNALNKPNVHANVLSEDGGRSEWDRRIHSVWEFITKNGRAGDC